MSLTHCLIIRDGPNAADEQRKWEEPCSVLKLPGYNFDLQQLIGSAPDYPSQRPAVDAVLLLPSSTKARIDDIIEIGELKLRILGLSSSYDSVGKLANYLVEAIVSDQR